MRRNHLVTLSRTYATSWTALTGRKTGSIPAVMTTRAPPSRNATGQAKLPLEGPPRSAKYPPMKRDLPPLRSLRLEGQAKLPLVSSLRPKRRSFSTRTFTNINVPSLSWPSSLRARRSLKSSPRLSWLYSPMPKLSTPSS